MCSMYGLNRFAKANLLRPYIYSKVYLGAGEILRGLPPRY